MAKKFDEVCGPTCIRITVAHRNITFNVLHVKAVVCIANTRKRKNELEQNQKFQNNNPKQTFLARLPL